MTYATDLRIHGTRVSYVDPDDDTRIYLGTTQTAYRPAIPEDCALVRFDDAGFAFVMPVSALRVLSPEDETDTVVALNALGFERVRTALNEAQQRFNRGAGRYGRSVARVADIRIQHDDFAGHYETWTVTIRAKSLKPRGL